jgi:PAS domain S-box-containing protein
MMSEVETLPVPPNLELQTLRERLQHAEAALVLGRQRMQTLQEVLTEIAQEGDLTTLLQCIVQRATELMYAASGTMYLWDTTAEMLLPVAWHGLDDCARTQRLKLGEGLVGIVAQRRQGLHVDNYQQSPYVHPVLQTCVGCAAVIGEPLLYREQLVGVLLLHRGQPFDDGERLLLSTLATQAAIAVATTRLVTDLTVRQQAAERLTTVGEFLLQSRDPEVVGQYIVDSMCQLLNAQVAVLWYAAASGDLVSFAVSTDARHLYQPGIILPSGSGTLGYAVRHRQLVTTTNHLTDPRFTFAAQRRAAVEQLPFHAVLAVPLTVEGQKIIGALGIATTSGRAFTAQETQLAQTFADQAALALANAQLFEQQKRQSEALQQSEARYRALVEGSLQGISISRDGIHLFVNTTLAKMFGYETANDLRGRSIWEHVAPHELDRLQGYFEARLRGEPAPPHYEYEACKRDGTPLWIERFISPIMWEGRIAFLGTYIDITARKRAEAALQRSEQQRLAIEKLAATAQMAAGIAHEINNPLAGMQNAFLLIKRTLPSDHPRMAYLDLVQREIDRISQIVRRMYQLYRPSAEAAERFDLRTVVAEVCDMLERLLGTKRVTVQYDFPVDLPALYLPRGDVMQIVYNLLLNALQASPPQAALMVTARRAEQTISLRVTDHGPGIPPEILPHIFKPFFTTKQPGDMGGMGLGLTVSRDLATAMGGALEVETSVGHGTTFTLALPCPPVSATPQAPSST